MERGKPRLVSIAKGQINSILKHKFASLFARPSLIRTDFVKSLFRKENVNGTTKKV